MPLSPEELHSNLAQFSGDEGVVSVTLSNRRIEIKSKSFGVLGVTYSQGVRYLIDRARCYWLIDMIVSHLPKVINDEDCEVRTSWILTKKGGGAVLEAKSHDRGRAGISQEIPYTDFPFPEDGVFKLYGGATTVDLNDEMRNVYNLFLSSEY